MSYYVLKTGMPMYDLERAYGLGLLVYTITKKETKVLDRGIYYEINADDVNVSDVEKRKEDILSLVAQNLNTWDNILKTVKKDKEKNKIKIAEILSNTASLKRMLEFYSKPFLPDAKPKSGKTLWLTLELSAAKGFREVVRGRRYHEGSSLKISEEDWALAIIGALHSVVWQFIPKNNENVAIIPSPDGNKGVNVSHLRDIREFLKETKGVNRVSTITLVTHSAIKLYQELWNRRRSENPWMDSFENFIYGSLVGAGPQSKPKEGGYFSLELFEEFLKLNNGTEVFELLDHIFIVGRKKGYEDLSISLANFLIEQTIENYSRFISIYLKTMIKKEIKIKKPDENIWQEIIKYVKYQRR